MSTMQDCELEQISRLFARGSLGEARKISKLLKAELGEQTEVQADMDLRSHFKLLFVSLLGKIRN